MLRPCVLLALLLLAPGLPARAEPLGEGFVVEPRARPPYEPWMLARLDGLRGRDPPALLLGDSLVSGWPEELWGRLLPAGALNLGAGGDTTANLLWRVRRALPPRAGEEPGMRLRAALLLAGTNDLPLRPAAAIAAGVRAVAETVLAAAPQACLTIVGLLPRRDGRADFDATIREANRRLAALAMPRARFVDPYPRLLAACPAAAGACALYKDSVHLTREGYALLTEAVAEGSAGAGCGG